MKAFAKSTTDTSLSVWLAQNTIQRRLSGWQAHFFFSILSLLEKYIAGASVKVLESRFNIKCHLWELKIVFSLTKWLPVASSSGAIPFPGLHSTQSGDVKQITCYGWEDLTIKINRHQLQYVSLPHSQSILYCEPTNYHFASSLTFVVLQNCVISHLSKAKHCIVLFLCTC